jgi:hypothetical protein
MPDPSNAAENDALINEGNQAQSDLSGKVSTELQMALDRRSKLAEVISNVETNSSDTEAAITQNLKP